MPQFNHPVSPHTRPERLALGLAIVAVGISLFISAEPAASKQPELPANSKFPRRMLFISISKYLYLNPLTTSRAGVDLTKPTAQRFAYDWRVPRDKDNDQLFVLSDTMQGPEARLPTRSVVRGTYEEFFKTSRAQDRVAVYFGGHAIEKGGKAYIAPMEAEPEGEDWEKSMIPLADFYAEVQKCKAAQKVVIWDVCRFNPQKGRARPGSEPMSKELYSALKSPPAGVQAVITCQAGENALEFSEFPVGPVGKVVIHSGSAFLDSMKFVGEPKNKRVSSGPSAPADPLPVSEWTGAIVARVSELTEAVGQAEELDNVRQTVTLVGAPPEKLTAPNPNEKNAGRFEFPKPPASISSNEVADIEGEFLLPPIKPDQVWITLTDFPFVPSVMKDYKSDGISVNDVKSNKARYPFRAAVVNSLEKIRQLWSPGTGATTLLTEVRGPINDALRRAVKKEQEFWAIGITELEFQLDSLKSAEKLRDKEPKRWQANYDFAVASVKMRLAYMNEYNKVLGHLITDTLPPLDPKLGHNGYTLAAWERFAGGNEVKNLTADARARFQDIATAYRGTPWAMRAKQEQMLTLGLRWKPAALSK